MSASHKFQLALHLKSLQNIGIRQTCYLQVRTIVYHLGQKKQLVTAKPYEIIGLEQNERGGRDQSFQPQIEDESFMSPKLVVKNMDKNINIGCLCLFKGEISIPKVQKHDHQIFVFCQLIWYQGKDMEVIGEWKGFSKLTSFSTYLDIYFCTHLLTCSLTASAHCVLSELCLKGEQNIALSAKQKLYYDHITAKTSPLYDACIDPLIESLVHLAQWTKQFKRNHLQEVKSKEINEILQASQRKENWKYWSLVRNGVKGSNYDAILGGLSTAQYMTNLKADCHNILSTLYPLWKNFLTLIKKYPQSPYTTSLKQKYQKSLQKDHWLNRIKLTNNNQQVKQVLEQKTQAPEFCSIEQHSSQIRLTCKDMEMLNKSVPRKKNRLIVLVHGFQASSFDMENIGMYLKWRNPDCYFLISEANQGMTEGVIEECGHRLAVQIKNYINAKQLKDFTISMIGHSLGGIIIRSSLRYLQLYKTQFECYMSLCSPHMGYLYHTSRVVTTSMWVMNQVKKDQSMIELAMSDSKDLKKCYMYELSERGELGWFNTVVFLGSKEDQYVPYSSAILEDMEFFYQSESAKIYKTMFNNLVKPIENKIVRLEILFNDRIKDLSGFIGRTAHIKVLSFLPVIDLYCHLVSKRI